MKLYGIHYRKTEILKKYWPLQMWTAVINSVRFERQVQQHQHLQHAVLSTHEHMAGAVTLQRIVIVLGKDQNPTKNFSLKVLAGKWLHNQAVIASIFENKCGKKSSKLDGDERLPQDSPFTTRHHYFSQQLRSKSYPVYKDSSVTGYRRHFILRWVIHPNAQWLRSKLPAFTSFGHTRHRWQTDAAVHSNRTGCRLWGSWSYLRAAWRWKCTNTTGN